MGITVYINGSWYWFENAKYLEDLLNEHCNDAGYEPVKNLYMEYDR